MILLVSAFSGCLNQSGNESSDLKDDTGEGVVVVATYYIEDFNDAKVSDSETLSILVKTIRNFDIIAVQGIGDPNGTAMETLVKELNNGTDESGNAYFYQYNLSGQIGPSGDKEQYAFIYNRNLVYPASIPRVYSEPNGDVFKWEPYMLAFRAHNGTGDILFINTHVNENNAADEIDQLAALVDYVKTIYAGQMNMTVLGNLYADEPYYNNQSTDSPLKSDEYVWATTDRCRSTLDGKAYDKIIVTEEISHFLIGSKGVFNITKEYNLTQEQAEAVSSHYPVYAEYWRYAPRT
ncbi:hypothetical protein [Methanimicrococcus stummii]|uniref:hypothetical protein n=1 Tax=Methanimicrococcus stummii TaxID=3028294 RepID=UPI00292F15EF|nr:hypothetical protein [Methanimicrococcus sp. Es2]